MIEHQVSPEEAGVGQTLRPDHVAQEGRFNPQRKRGSSKPKGALIPKELVVSIPRENGGRPNIIHDQDYGAMFQSPEETGVGQTYRIQAPTSWTRFNPQRKRGSAKHMCHQCRSQCGFNPQRKRGSAKPTLDSLIGGIWFQSPEETGVGQT